MGMSPEQWDRVKDLYEAALDCTPPQRATFLRQSGEDQVICDEVGRLLSEHSKLGSFLSSPPFIDSHRTTAPSEKRLMADETEGGYATSYVEWAFRFRLPGALLAGADVPHARNADGAQAPGCLRYWPRYTPK
jgi:hypothetical protein